MSKHNCQQIEPLLPATAAGALDPEEHVEIQAHLARCGFCVRKLQEYEETVVQLAYAVPQVHPPAGLRAQVLAVTARATPVEAASPLPFQPRASGIAERGAVSSTPGRSILDVLGSFYRRLAPAALALSVVLLVFSGGALFAMNQQMDGMRETVDDAAMMKKVLATDGAMRTELKPKTEDAKVSGQVIMAPGEKQVVLLANHLPTPTAGQSYRLWMLHRDQPPVAAGEVTVDGNGVAMCTVDVPEDPTMAEGVAVSKEQDNAPSDKPEGTVLLEGWYK